ncbi:hypothetical protein BaRGS_00011904 [Batillaria attramentaria]|uniref:Uncharacterized protein n=1 Tax=Batillaria attramentaria TaxID=370345 RepID=A0ABD0LBW5_9CAEN
MCCPCPPPVRAALGTTRVRLPPQPIDTYPPPLYGSVTGVRKTGWVCRNDKIRLTSSTEQSCQIFPRAAATYAALPFPRRTQHWQPRKEMGSALARRSASAAVS